MVRVRNTRDRGLLIKGVAKVRPGDTADVSEATAEKLVTEYDFERVDGDADDDVDDLEALTYDELYDRAADADVSGRSSMDKDELIAALETAEG